MSSPVAAVDVVGIGECLVAFQPLTTGPLFAATSFEAHVVGAEANVCVGLARLEHRAAFIGRVGADGLGESIVRQLRMEDLDTSGTIVDPTAPTGVQIRERRGFGSSEFLYYRRDSAGSRLAAEDVHRHEAMLTAARWIHLSGITLALSADAREASYAAAELAAAGETGVSFDLNLRTKLWPDAEEAADTLLDFVRRCDLVFAGESEAAFLVGDGAVETLGERLLAAIRPGGTVVLKLGPAGAVAFWDGRALASPAQRVERVDDVVGAGDAFAAGFLSGRLDGLPDEESLVRANTCGAFAVAASGDMRGLPRRHEVQRFATSLDEVVR